LVEYYGNLKPGPEGKAAIVEPEDCWYCMNCEAICLFEVIQCPYEIILTEEDRTL
jgi:NAD-dependent dihydropyrimidine dehydrogenase PreA subunit